MRRQVRLLILAALAVPFVVACKRGGEERGGVATEGAAAAAARVPREPLPASAVRVSGNNFHVDAAPAAGCATGGSCSVLADLTATSGFKVNEEYPYRFVPDAASRPLVDGEAAFAVTSPHTGRLMVPVRAGVAAGTRIGGTFKLSVCSADVCQIEAAVVDVAVN